MIFKFKFNMDNRRVTPNCFRPQLQKNSFLMLPFLTARGKISFLAIPSARLWISRPLWSQSSLPSLVSHRTVVLHCDWKVRRILLESVRLMKIKLRCKRRKIAKPFFLTMSQFLKGTVSQDFHQFYFLLITF